MTGDLRARKVEIRKAVREMLRTMTDAERRAGSASACHRLEGKAAWQRAACVLLFHPLPDEPDITPLLHAALAAGKEVALPRFASSELGYLPASIRSLQADLQPGLHGTHEPASTCPAVPLNRLDFALVPGVAFTLDGRRLGRGKGYYDRLLTGVRGLKAGVAFDLQLVGTIPVEPHDCRVDCILTPSLWHCVDPGAVME